MAYKHPHAPNCCNCERRNESHADKTSAGITFAPALEHKHSSKNEQQNRNNSQALQQHTSLSKAVCRGGFSGGRTAVTRAGEIKKRRELRRCSLEAKAPKSGLQNPQPAYGILRNHNGLGVAVAAHSIGCARVARANGVLIATRVLGFYRDLVLAAADDGIIRIER